MDRCVWKQIIIIIIIIISIIIIIIIIINYLFISLSRTRHFKLADCCEKIPKVGGSYVIVVCIINVIICKWISL